MWRSTRTAHTNFPERTQSDSVSTALLSLHKHITHLKKFTPANKLPGKSFFLAFLRQKTYAAMSPSLHWHVPTTSDTAEATCSTFMHCHEETKRQKMFEFFT